MHAALTGFVSSNFLCSWLKLCIPRYPAGIGVVVGDDEYRIDSAIDDTVFSQARMTRT